MDNYVHKPNHLKPKLCVWADLNVHNMDQILKCTNNTETRNQLQKIFSLDETAKDQVLLDLYMHLILFAKLQNFSKEQTSAFFSIVKQTHEMCVSTPFGNVEECFSFFRELVLTHSVHRPPWSLKIFATDQVETITTHVINSYFRHFKLYKYTFTPKVKLDISFQYNGLAPSPVPTPTDEVYNDAETLNIEVEQKPTPTPVEEPEIVESNQIGEESTPAPENEATNELETIVRKAVTSQLKLMHASVEKQLEDTDKAINDKILALEVGRSASQNKSGKRSPKASAKGKRK